MLSVSIAMATYNGERHIRRQLESLAAQDYTPTELVITDDGSTDKTLAIIEKFSDSSPFPIHLHRNETRLGYRANFMRATGLCTSDLIAFCDQDDYWYPRKISACVSCFGDPETLLAFHNADVVTSNGERIGNIAIFAARRSIRPMMPPLSFSPMAYAYGFTQVFRRRLLELSRFWPMSLDQNDHREPVAHDQWFFFLASVFGNIGYLDEPLVAYVQHARNIFGLHTNPQSKLQGLLTNLADDCTRLSQAARCRATILETAISDLDAVWRQRAETAAKKYRSLSDLYAYRSTIYGAPDFGSRIHAYWKILTNAGYFGLWGVGRKSLIKDLCLGVPIGPFLMRRGS